ncbi:hypothetical protein H072_5493 [Dactylellina haptotyla CBS 200.50]|uniref:JmjC domain-containing protein n=1 Tax=Dactylellina haptotyla (strain CBS 200.50) TaxID=1284197 RepID=S8ACF0_DACHA|nr:hypothetical protein H072_5493 [Dactylellina haptotyla CBS 200.50]
MPRPKGKQALVNRPAKPNLVMPAPTVATAAHGFIQRMTCQSLKKNGNDIIQCQSCIERRNDSGGCRFAGFRAFKLKSSATEPSATVPSDSLTSKNSAKRKGTSSVYIAAGKKRKLSPQAALSIGLDYRQYALVGDRPKHKAAEKDKGCLMSTGIKIGNVLQQLPQSDSYIMSNIASVLSKCINRELQHEEQKAHPNLQHPIIRIAEDPSQRSLCDACATTLFIVSYVCHICGREYCPYCYDDWNDGIENIRFETCSRHQMHTKEQLVLAVRACEGEVKTIAQEINMFIRISKGGARILDIADEHRLRLKYATRRLRDVQFAPVYEFRADDFTEDSFREIWGLHGRPIVIKDCLNRFKLSWDPQYFINHHGHEDCTLVQTCPPFRNYTTKVSEFFEQFGQFHPTEGLKLKDWPPADNFSDVFPELMVDFERALPDAISNYVKHSGIYNLVSRFPDDYNRPDLGPKMYNAFPASVQMDGKLGGTTNLHRDITDAINFMMYATPATNYEASSNSSNDEEDRSPGAIWDIFPVGATRHIREYLDEKYPNQTIDPFHRQNCYLTQEDIRILFELHGVQSYRILQRPGDAILVPAGCAHQVRNIKDCIKVAVDFLSPESVETCEYLFQENRAIAERANNYSKGKETKKISRVKKEDVLQLWKCLMYYYEGIREQLWGAGSHSPSEGNIAFHDETNNINDGDSFHIL